MSSVFLERVCAAFAPPRYLVPQLAGIDLSTSGVKAVRLAKGAHGLTLASYAETLLADNTYANGEIVDRAAIVKAIVATAKSAHLATANVSLPEPKSYLFETTVSGEDKAQWRTAVEQHLDELIPLPPALSAFDIINVGVTEKNESRIVGIGFAQRIVDDTLAVFDEAKIGIRALEVENFSVARALLPKGDDSTVLIIDVGKTTTKLSIVSKCIPRFATTIGIGGHALTLAVQKYFNVDESEARKVKAERGIVPSIGNEEYLAATLSTVSAIRDEISSRLDYWQAKATAGGMHEPVTHAILAGGNASMRGFPEYLESSLKIPVAVGDVFTNFASRDTWFPPIEFAESLAYATAIGLALYDEHTL